ncbi:MAG: ABC transporter ATP-binding protein, partial [Granulosicoccus sp.]|nr:ABC transporter ATP-binding protein [Granulosicoccus sp.]
MTTVLDIRGLHVAFDTPDGVVHAVRGVDCQINQAECVGIVGESGSGKSQTFLAAMGLLANNAGVRGSINFHNTDLLELRSDELNKIRGDRISMIFQDPLTSLTPHMRIGRQMQEVLSQHQNLKGKAAEKLCTEWLDRVRIPQPESRMQQYPHELSGGMRQRVMIAMAMLCKPELMIADEPSTALDVTVQSDILDLMNDIRRDQGTAIVLITHDMGVVARMCDRVHVMQSGRFLESGDADTVFYRPAHAYTRMLLDAVPTMELSATEPKAQDTRQANNKPLLQVENLSIRYAMSSALFKPVKTHTALDSVSFNLFHGEILGIVGESGSGKSSLARAVLNLIPNYTGAVTYLGTPIGGLTEPVFKQYRRDMQIVFQDPLASFNPAMVVGESIMEPLKVFEPSLSRQQARERVKQMMQSVDLNEDLYNRYPHELSGGQNQRAGIARAIILNPQLVICDEAVSALDVSVQSQVLKLLKSLQSERNLSFIFISHDLSVIWQIADRVLVLKNGEIVESGHTRTLFSNPTHPYTQSLLDAVPLP